MSPQMSLARLSRNKKEQRDPASIVNCVQEDVAGGNPRAMVSMLFLPPEVRKCDIFIYVTTIK